jgi:hypothetical protein
VIFGPVQPNVKAVRSARRLRYLFQLFARVQTRAMLPPSTVVSDTRRTLLEATALESCTYDVRADRRSDVLIVPNFSHPDIIMHRTSGK